MILDEAMYLQNLDATSKLSSRLSACRLLISFDNTILTRSYLEGCFRDLYGILRAISGDGC